MGFGKYVLALILALLFFGSTAFSQDAVMTLNHKELGPHQRPLVTFNHEKHSSNIDCLQCHHDFDKYGNNKGGEGQPCSVCHGQTVKPGQRYTLLDAFHMQCKGCHEKMQARGYASGPVMCGGCHTRK